MNIPIVKNQYQNQDCLLNLRMHEKSYSQSADSKMNLLQFNSTERHSLFKPDDLNSS